MKTFPNFGSTENQSHYFFTEPKVSARNFLVRDFSLLYFGVRKRDDNHRVKLEAWKEPLGPSSTPPHFKDWETEAGEPLQARGEN